MIKAMKLQTITGHATINAPYTNHRKQLKKYNTNIPDEISPTFFVFMDLIICGSINDVPTAAAINPIMSAIKTILDMYFC